MMEMKKTKTKTKKLRLPLNNFFVKPDIVAWMAYYQDSEFLVWIQPSSVMMEGSTLKPWNMEKYSSTAFRLFSTNAGLW